MKKETALQTEQIPQQAFDWYKANYQAHIYKDAQHGFHNDSTSRYSPENAELFWSRTWNKLNYSEPSFIASFCR